MYIYIYVIYVIYIYLFIYIIYIYIHTYTHTYMRQLRKQLEAFSERYEHFLIIGDFNVELFDLSMTSFCSLFKLKSIVKEPTCYKNPENPSCIDLFLTNCPRSFHNTCLYETGLFDFDKLVVTIL